MIRTYGGVGGRRGQPRLLPDYSVIDRLENQQIIRKESRAMLEYIVAHKETFLVLGIMVFLGIVMFIITEFSRRSSAKGNENPVDKGPDSNK